MSKRTISFSVETEEKKAYLNKFAKKKGFSSVSAMARYTLYNYCNKFKDYKGEQ